MLAELVRLLASGNGDVLSYEAHEGPSLTMLGADKGDGSLQDTSRTARELGVADRLKLPGPAKKSDVPARLAEADVFINTTEVDNVPISVLEAMACGLCVVSTDVGGIPYLIEDSHNGLLVPRDDPEAMASAVARIVTDPSLAARLSSNGRATAASFDWSRVLPDWQQLLRDVTIGAR